MMSNAQNVIHPTLVWLNIIQRKRKGLIKVLCKYIHHVRAIFRDRYVDPLIDGAGQNKTFVVISMLPNQVNPSRCRNDEWFPGEFLFKLLLNTFFGHLSDG